MYGADLGLNSEVTEMLKECEQPGLSQTLLLPEDVALRHLPALSAAHRRLDFSHRDASLSPLQEVRSRHSKWTAQIWFSLNQAFPDHCLGSILSLSRLLLMQFIKNIHFFPLSPIEHSNWTCSIKNVFLWSRICFYTLSALGKEQIVCKNVYQWCHGPFTER